MTRNEAIKAITTHKCYIESIPGSDNTVKALEVAVEALEEPEQIKGKWVDLGEVFGGWHCSECDASAPYWCMASTQYLTTYCPNCGAKMEEQECD